MPLFSFKFSSIITKTGMVSTQINLGRLAHEYINSTACFVSQIVYFLVIFLYHVLKCQITTFFSSLSSCTVSSNVVNFNACNIDLQFKAIGQFSVE